MALIFAEFQKYMPNEYEFERMENYNDDFNGMSYDEFLELNEQCFNDLSQADRAFIEHLHLYIRSGKVNLTDMESCVEFQSSGIYFNTKKVICVFNPR